MTEPPRRTGLPSLTNAYAYDGDGNQIRSDENGGVKYELRSSLLRGQLLTDINTQGQKITGYVYVNGGLLAKQNQGASQAESTVTWVHRSPDASGEWETVSAGWGESLSRSLQLDAVGRDVGLDNPYDSGGDGLGGYPTYGDPEDMTSGCSIDHDIMPCDFVIKFAMRDQGTRLYLITHSRVGVLQPQYDTEAVLGGSTSSTSGSWEIDPNGASDQNIGAVTVTAGADGLMNSLAGFNMVWLSLLPTVISATRIEPQNPAPPADTRTDCQRFVDRVAEIALKHNDVGDFVDDLARTFIGVASGDVDEMRQNANTHTGEYFPSSGFKEGLYDTLRDNQARHFMGGLIAGYKLGGVAGALVMNHNEDSQADLRVNKISIPLGASLTNPRSEEIVDRGDRGGWRRIPATPGFKALADAIRNQICDK